MLSAMRPRVHHIERILRCRNCIVTLRFLLHYSPKASALAPIGDLRNVDQERESDPFATRVIDQPERKRNHVTSNRHVARCIRHYRHRIYWHYFD